MGLPAEDQNLGQYIIDEKIAQGGMAEIFKGRSLDPGGLERPVVIKRILPQISADPEFVEMLVREAKLAVQLSHGNIAQVYDLGRLDDDYFMVMEFVDGESLSRIARHLRQSGQWMPVPIALYIVSEVANGLAYMHNKSDASGRPLNIVHRDISPQNVIISWSGTVKVIDFGIAKAATQLSTTDSGVVKGKFAYMSPEHVNGEKLDSRTDIFSLAVILWELLTNQRLFKGKNNRETINRVKRCRIPSVLGYRDDIPKSVDKFLKKALSKNRKNRYDNAHDFQMDLIRTLVQDFPDFAPKELQDYLRSLFTARIREETTVVGDKLSVEDPTLIDNAKEATALANPDVLKKRLEELETYDMGIQEPEPDVSAPSESAEEIAEIVKRPPLWKRWGSACLYLMGLIPWSAMGRFLLRPRVLKSLIILTLIGTLGYGVYKVSPQIRDYFGFGTTQVKPKLPVRPEIDKKPLPPPPPPPPPIQYGELKVSSEPAGARIYVNDRDTGLKTPNTIQKLEAGLIYRIGLFLKPYEYWEGKAEVSNKAESSLHAQLAVNYGAIQVTSLPAKAQVFLDGKAIGQTPVALKQLKPGQLYKVRIEHAGYHSWEQTAKAFAGKTIVLRAVLKKE